MPTSLANHHYHQQDQSNIALTPSARESTRPPNVGRSLNQPRTRGRGREERERLREGEGREGGREGEKGVPMRGMVVMGKRIVSKEERRVFSCLKVCEKCEESFLCLST